MRLALATAFLLLLPLSPALAQAPVPFSIPDTGQTACYSDQGPLTACPEVGAPFYGQDGSYTTAPPRYRDNGDGTVSDLVTGLMWQSTFQRNVGYADAQGLADQATTGDHGDWRVPTITELYSLMDFSGSTGSGRPESRAAPGDARPYLDAAVFDFEYPTTGRYIDAQYISATTYTGTAMGRAAFFGVNFADGRIKGYPQGGHANGRGFYLRLVRGNTAYGENAFRDAGGGVIEDTATGLSWMQADSAHADFAAGVTDTALADGRMDWAEALGFCEALTLGDRSDWRLPNAKELQSIVDYGRSPAATGTAAIDPIFDASPIVDETGEDNYGAYWTGTTLLDGPRQGSEGVVVFFGEALGAPRAMGPRNRFDGNIIDVHGAGAQRSDPKTGAPSDYPVSGHGPQGDVRRVFNLVRCVSGG